jgi:hypothetical protein
MIHAANAPTLESVSWLKELSMALSEALDEHFLCLELHVFPIRHQTLQSPLFQALCIIRLQLNPPVVHQAVVIFVGRGDTWQERDVGILLKPAHGCSDTLDRIMRGVSREDGDLGQWLVVLEDYIDQGKTQVFLVLDNFTLVFAGNAEVFPRDRLNFADLDLGHL